MPLMGQISNPHTDHKHTPFVVCSGNEHKLIKKMLLKQTVILIGIKAACLAKVDCLESTIISFQHSLHVVKTSVIT